MEEAYLIDLCKQKDAKAQKALYLHYINEVLKLSMRYLNDKTEIEDIAQHTFIKVFDNINQFKYLGEGSFKAWLLRIATNECLMYIRKNSKYKTYFIEDNTLLDSKNANNEFPLVLSNYQLAHIYNCIKKLPEGYRTILNLYVFEEMTHEAIANALDISINTSKSQLSRARQLLKKLLNS